jgi:hypothetical protein
MKRIVAMVGSLAAVLSLSGCGSLTRNAAFDWRGPHPVAQWYECENHTAGNREDAQQAYDSARGKYRSAGSEAGAVIGANIVAMPGSIYRCMIAHGYTFEPMGDPMTSDYNEDYIRDERETFGNEVKNSCHYETPADRRNFCAGKD